MDGLDSKHFAVCCHASAAIHMLCESPHLSTHLPPSAAIRFARALQEREAGERGNEKWERRWGDWETMTQGIEFRGRYTHRGIGGWGVRWSIDCEDRGVKLF